LEFVVSQVPSAAADGTWGTRPVEVYVIDDIEQPSQN
jgi:hypothetical protein